MSSSTQVTGSLASRVIRSMLAPLAAIRPQGAAEHGDVQPAVEPARRRPGWRLRRPGGDLGLQPQVAGQLGDDAVDRRQVRWRVAGEQDAEHQPALDRHLLDVSYAQRKARDGAEQPRGDAGPVTAGQRDQDRGPWSIHLVLTVPSGWAPAVPGDQLPVAHPGTWMADRGAVA
jgi:hypothetical protein